ncbi:MAG: polyprenyl synthetase family protein [SAR324 cluster bacterium]|nr:polyprenyl synthetase family protein [SAR324 cluster bacterium]
MTIHEILASVSPYMQKTEAMILEDIQHHVPLITHVSDHILQSGGKRIRPAMLILSAQAFGAIHKPVLRAAQVVEYIHTATLLHDDVVDNATLRRSRKTARNIWGNEASVLVGDYLFSMAFHMLVQLKEISVLNLMSETTTLMARGEISQLLRNNEAATEQEYLDIIFKKTACLFAASTKMGAILNQASPEAQQAMYDYGMAVGMAFQIVDDTLDYVDNETQTGKAPGIDLRERKITLPLRHLLDTASEMEKEHLKEILQSPEITEKEVKEVISLMKQHASLEYSLKVAENYIDQACLSLEVITDSSIRKTLSGLARFVVSRNG